MSTATAAVTDGNGAATSDEDYELISVGIEKQSHHEPPTTPNPTTHDHTLVSIVTDELKQHERFAPSTIGASATATPANPSAYSNDLQAALLSPNNTKTTFNQPLSSGSQVPCVKISCGRYFLYTLCTTLGCANFIVGFSSSGENCITLPIYSLGIGVMCMLMVLLTCKPDDSANMSYILRIMVCFIGVLLLPVSFLPLKMEWLIEKSCQDPDHHDIRLLMLLNIVIIFVSGLSLLCYYCWGYHIPQFRLTSFQKQPGKLLLILLCTIAIVASAVNLMLSDQRSNTNNFVLYQSSDPCSKPYSRSCLPRPLSSELKYHWSFAYVSSLAYAGSHEHEPYGDICDSTNGFHNTYAVSYGCYDQYGHGTHETQLCPDATPNSKTEEALPPSPCPPAHLNGSNIYHYGFTARRGGRCPPQCLGPTDFDYANNVRSIACFNAYGEQVNLAVCDETILDQRPNATHLALDRCPDCSNQKDGPILSSWMDPRFQPTEPIPAFLVYQPTATGSPTSHVCGRLSFATICCTIIFGVIESCLIASLLFGEKKYPAIQQFQPPPPNPPPVTVVSASDVPAAPNTHPLQPPPPNIMNLEKVCFALAFHTVMSHCRGLGVACYYCSRLLILLINGLMMVVDGICDLYSYGARTLWPLWRLLLVLFVAIALLLLCIVAVLNMLWSTYLNCPEFRISAIVNMIVSFILTTVWGTLLITNRQRIIKKGINPFEVLGLLRPEG